MLVVTICIHEELAFDPTGANFATIENSKNPTVFYTARVALENLVRTANSSFEWRQVQSDTAMRNNITVGYSAHLKQKKKKRFTIVA